MNWQTMDMCNQEIEEQKHQALQEGTDNEIIEEKKALQLLKYRDPLKDEARQNIISIMSRFGDRIVNGTAEEIAWNLFTEDCQVFSFSSTGKKNLKRFTTQTGFPKLYKGIHFLERWVRETNVDVEKNIGFQLSNCRIFYEEDDSFEDEVVFEVFNIKDERISKYRAHFAKQTPAHGDDVSELSFKELMIAKVREINYAWADQPDLEKVASFFEEDIEYKVWSWDDHKYFVFNKDNFARNFRTMEENIAIKCIVPYNIFTGPCFAVSAYVYHLENKLTGEKLVWMNIIVYAFDDELKIRGVRQQGEVLPETKDSIPFQHYQKETILEKVKAFFSHLKPNYDLFYNDILQYNCEFCRFGPEELSFIGLFHGLKAMEYVNAKGPVAKSTGLQWQPVDIFVDHQDPSYEVAIVLSYGTRKTKDCFVKFASALSVLKFFFENGKLVKIYQFFNPLDDSIPICFDNKEFMKVDIDRDEDEELKEC